MSKAKLRKEHQIFVVVQLATYERPTDVQEALKRDFGVEVSLPAILNYDISNPDLAVKWRELFTQTRQNFIDDTSLVPIAVRSWRLKQLQKMFDAELAQPTIMQNKKGMRATLEMAAKESGEAFTNKFKHEHTGKDGKPLGPRTITINVVESDSILTEEVPQDG